MAAQYKTRWHQIQSFLRQYDNDKMDFAELVRSIALVAACAERDRTLEILRACPYSVAMALHDQIASEAIPSVVGWDRTKEGTT